jgi:hypothetical protein
MTRLPTDEERTAGEEEQIPIQAEQAPQVDDCIPSEPGQVSDQKHRLSPDTEPKLCEPCQALLRGSRTKLLPQEYSHHEDTESFERALGLQCGICVRLWAALNRAAGMFRHRLLGRSHD